MAPTNLALKIAIGLLMADAIIELSFVSFMVAWLHKTASHGFSFTHDNATYLLAGTPSAFLVDQGHTSNGAAGTAFVLIGLGGILGLWLRSRSTTTAVSGWRNIVYYVWTALNVPALLLTLGALAYVFAVTKAHEGQTIDAAVAAQLGGSAYGLGSWTPQNWFPAVLELDLVTGRADIESHLAVIRGWQYNLIPFFVIQLCETVLAVVDLLAWRRAPHGPKYEVTQMSESA